MRGFTQEALAEYLGVERSTVARWERGTFTPQPWVRPQLATALAVTTDQLDALFTSLEVRTHPSSGSEPAPDSADHSDSTGSDIIHAQLPILRRVLDAHDLPDDGPVRALEQLEQLVGAVVGMRLNSEYTRLVSVLPPLLAELNRALSLYNGQRRTMTAQLLAQAYRAADAIADKFGYFDLSARIIALMQSAAFASGDELVTAAASYVRAETFFASDNFEAGRQMLELAASRLMPGASTDSAAAYGALRMRAAVTAARAGHAGRAHDHLDEADRIACHVPEGIYHGTAFGSASVRIHRVTLAVDLDDVAAALHFAGEWVPPPEIPAERRSHYFVDLGCARLQAGQYDRAIGALRAAREIAPQHIRVHPDVRQALFALLEIGVTEIAEFIEWTRGPKIMD